MVLPDDIDDDNSRAEWASRFEALAKFRQTLPYGIRQVFDELLSWLSQQPDVAATLPAVIARWNHLHNERLPWQEGIKAVANDIGHVDDGVETIRRMIANCRATKLKSNKMMMNQSQPPPERTASLEPDAPKSTTRALDVVALRGLINHLPCEHTRAAGLTMLAEIINVNQKEEEEIATLGKDKHQHLLEHTDEKHRNKVGEYIRPSPTDLMNLVPLMVHFASEKDNRRTANRLARKYLDLSLGLRETTAVLNAPAIASEDLQAEIDKTTAIAEKNKRNTGK